jgi:hypothetical protein
MRFLERFGHRILGVLRGLDRIRFRGTLRRLASEWGIQTFVQHSGLLLKDFGRWAGEKTRQVRVGCEHRAEELGIEAVYLQSSGVDKEQLARTIAKDKGITEGPICLFSVVEPCRSPTVVGNRATGKLELRMRWRKCVWLYLYFDDPEVGFGHVRLQSWLPMSVLVCLNGRHWLEKQMIARGLAYLKDGNCFPWVKDPDQVQELLHEQLRTSWPTLLNRLTLATCPSLPELLAPLRLDYYWSAEETEYATDFLFRSAGDLDALYPSLIRHAMVISDSPAVLRFLGGRTVTAHGRMVGPAPQEVLSDYRRRYEGVRVKHWINQNSVKVYNKSASVLRLETTINHTRDFKVYRSPEDDPSRPPSWQKLRKGVSDLHRRCHISDQSNERYADSLSAAHAQETLHAVAREACHRVVREGKRYRALNPWNDPDFRLLSFLGKGQWALNGFRNRDLRAWLYPHAAGLPPEEAPRISARVTRRLRLLRAHGLVRKVPRVHRYVLTETGRKFSAALLSASVADIKKLMEIAA